LGVTELLKKQNWPRQKLSPKVVTERSTMCLASTLATVSPRAPEGFQSPV